MGAIGCNCSFKDSPQEFNMNQDINKRINEKEQILMTKKQNILKYVKYFLNVIKIQRTFRKFKVKCSQNVVYDHQMAKARLSANNSHGENKFSNNEENRRISGFVDDKVRNLFQDSNLEALILNEKYRETKIKHGFGVQIWKDGAKFIGYFIDNKANGWGRFKHIDGDDYAGEFINDRANGFGLYKHSNGANYFGYWQDDAQDGYGIETWNDGSHYEGEYIKGKKHGYGTYQWTDGSKYQGEWEDNCLNGFGMYYFTDQRTFIGQWKNNSMHGYGEFRWKDGKKYIGFYKNDKKDGFGIYYWEEPNKVYIGFWKNGKQDGIGKYIVTEKTYYGIWNLGEKVKLCKDFQEVKNFFTTEQKKYSYLFSFDMPKIKKFINQS